MKILNLGKFDANAPAEYKNYPTSLKRINVQTPHSLFPLPFLGPWLLHHTCYRQVSAGGPIPRPDQRRSQTVRIYLRQKRHHVYIKDKHFKERFSAIRSPALIIHAKFRS